MDLAPPGDVARGGGGPGFEPSMALFQGFVAVYRGIGEVARRLFGEEEFDILAQVSLVRLEGQDVIGALVDDLFRDVALAAHGVDGHRRAFDHQQLQELRDGDDLVRFVRHLDLA